jgi:hypothetical protein
MTVCNNRISTDLYQFLSYGWHNQWPESIGECPSNSPFLKNNGAEAPKRQRPIVFEGMERYKDILQLKIHPLYFINFIDYYNLVTKNNLCIVSKVQSIKLFAPCGTLKVQREQ